MRAASSLEEMAATHARMGAAASGAAAPAPPTCPATFGTSCAAAELRLADPAAARTTADMMRTVLAGNRPCTGATAVRPRTGARPRVRLEAACQSHHAAGHTCRRAVDRHCPPVAGRSGPCAGLARPCRHAGSRPVLDPPRPVALCAVQCPSSVPPMVASPASTCHPARTVLAPM